MSRLPERIRSRFVEPETVALADLTVQFLMEFHGYSEDDAVRLMTQYCDHFEDEEVCGAIWSLENHIHHELPYRLAAMVHYREGLTGTGDVTSFMRKNGFYDTPFEVQQRIFDRLEHGPFE